MTEQGRRLYAFGPFKLDPGAQILRRDGRVIPLKPKVFDLLVVLVENRDRVVPKEEVMRLVWAESFVEDSNLAVSVCELRKILGDGHNDHAYIATAPRRGYRFVASVTEETDGVDDGAAWPPGVSGTPRNGLGAREGIIAVLPFKSIGASGDEYLGLGMADALITKLSNLGQITVRPTSSVRRYDGTQDPVAAGRELGVEWVLDGSVQRSGKRIRATVQLVNVGDGASKWAGKFDERFTDIFGVEDSISEQVVNALTLKLNGKERTLLAKRYTDNTEAYQAYLKGRYFLNKGSSEDFKKAMGQFELAIKADPSYALAYAGLADTHCMLAGHVAISRQEAGPKAREAALEAVALDDALAEAHASLAFVRMYFDWNWAEAERGFKRALQLNPNCAPARDKYVILLRTTGRAAEAIDMMKRAQKADPLSLTTNATLGSALCVAREFDEAIEQLLGTLDLDANFSSAHFFLALSYEGKGKYEEALYEYQRVVLLEGDDAELLAAMGRIHAVTGKRDEALRVIDLLMNSSAPVHWTEPYLIALVYAGLGDTARAFEWLERGYAEHDIGVAGLAADHRMDCLGEDPRYTNLLAMMGLPMPATARSAKHPRAVELEYAAGEGLP
jgi:DNA-binding winged helix-turn-helix (wHTH) protein/TolB-like protein/Flp pilus assembly protein TadD